MTIVVCSQLYFCFHRSILSNFDLNQIQLVILWLFCHLLNIMKKKLLSPTFYLRNLKLLCPFSLKYTKIEKDLPFE